MKSSSSQKRDAVPQLYKKPYAHILFCSAVASFTAKNMHKEMSELRLFQEKDLTHAEKVKRREEQDKTCIKSLSV